MATINLLPWREERREELKKEFLAILGGVAVLAGVIVFAWHGSISSATQNQIARNNYLQAQIDELSAQVEEISELRKKRAELIDRMKIIQDLQGTRPEIVHYFDDIVRTVPDGVFFTKVARTGGMLEIAGTAESNNRVSGLMRRLANSEWFSDPNLLSVKANPSFGDQANDFELTVALASPVTAEQNDKKGK